MEEKERQTCDVVTAPVISEEADKKPGLVGGARSGRSFPVQELQHFQRNVRQQRV